MRRDSLNLTDWKLSYFKFFTLSTLIKYHTPRLIRLLSHSEMPMCGEEKVTNRLNNGQYSCSLPKAALAIRPPSENPTKLTCAKSYMRLEISARIYSAACAPRESMDWFMSLVMD